jgi:hypothetical protein
MHIAQLRAQPSNLHVQYVLVCVAALNNCINLLNNSEYNALFCSGDWKIVIFLFSVVLKVKTVIHVCYLHI